MRSELDPPIQVDVLRGRVMGKQLAAIDDAKPLPEKMLERFKQERFEE